MIKETGNTQPPPNTPPKPHHETLPFLYIGVRFWNFFLEVPYGQRLFGDRCKIHVMDFLESYNVAKRRVHCNAKKRDVIGSVGS